MQPTIALTGVTGQLGGRVAELMQDLSSQLRLLVRDPQRAPKLYGHMATTSYDSPQAASALTGTDVLFMVSAGESPDRLDVHRAFIDAAVTAGVKHVVYTSFLGASPEATFTLARDHWYTEEHLRGSGLAWTFLRDSFYLDFLPHLATEGVIRGPAGTGRVGAVARDDVARSAAAVLRDPGIHAGQTYELTGPQRLSLAEVAQILTQAGKATRYLPETIAEAYASRAGYGAPAWEVDAWVSTYTAIAAGELDVVTDCVEQLTGQPPVSLTELLG